MSRAGTKGSWRTHGVRCWAMWSHDLIQHETLKTLVLDQKELMPLGLWTSALRHSLSEKRDKWALNFCQRLEEIRVRNSHREQDSRLAHADLRSLFLPDQSQFEESFISFPYWVSLVHLVQSPSTCEKQLSSPAADVSNKKCHTWGVCINVTVSVRNVKGSGTRRAARSLSKILIACVEP